MTSADYSYSPAPHKLPKPLKWRAYQRWVLANQPERIGFMPVSQRPKEWGR